jgi:hypothetical protein
MSMLMPLSERIKKYKCLSSKPVVAKTCKPSFFPIATYGKRFTLSKIRVSFSM